MQIKRLEEDVGRPLFQREGRSLRPNAAAQDLLLYARRLLRLSDEAVASLRRTDAAGTVRLGMPEDYAAHLLTPTLARFGQEFPLAEIELTLDSSPALLRLLDIGKLDHVLVTRDPLPVAPFEAGDLARRFAVEALQAVDRRYRVVSTTHTLLSLITVAEAGLAVVGLIESCVPPGLTLLGEADGLPVLPVLDLSLLADPGEPPPLVQHLRDHLTRDLRDD